MSNRNASASAFGWDFQVNAAILLLLENIEEANHIRVEGADEDIEITLNDKSKIYAQAKAVAKPDDTSNVIKKLKDAIETLNEDAKKSDGYLFTYITNSPNPFNDKRTTYYFTGKTHLKFDELPDSAKKKIDDIIRKNKYTDLALPKFDIRVLPFYGDDLNNRYKEIKACIDEFLGKAKINISGINNEIMKVWQKDFFNNATLQNTSISITKDKIVWPLIVLVINDTAATEYKKDFNDDESNEIDHKYHQVITYSSLKYENISNVINGFFNSRESKKNFVNNHWNEYLNMINEIEAEEKIKESLIKIILYKIITQKECIRSIKRVANL